FASYLPRAHFSVISLSILAAVGHIAGQLLVVRFWLIPHAGVVYLVPVLMLAAVFFGLINGVITAGLLRNVRLLNKKISKNVMI
ncbi:MAG: heptaprenyl diphosphate synthase, partial [Methylotenera sp.]|nr:heptaprenyl diphosphate synthase [Methylotenera sp.]